MATSQTSFIGTGWSFPPRFRDGGAGLDMVAGSEDISQSLTILLATQFGERVMRYDFGCDLSQHLFDEINQTTVNALTALVSGAIIHHEPRIKLEKVDISDDGSRHGLLLIRIDYTVRATNSRFNMVYPFYLQEAQESITAR